MTPDMTILIVSIAWFLGGFVNGVSGMGAAMVALPIVAGFMDMSEAVPSSCLVTCIVAGYVAMDVSPQLPHGFSMANAAWLPPRSASWRMGAQICSGNMATGGARQLVARLYALAIPVYPVRST